MYKKDCRGRFFLPAPLAVIQTFLPMVLFWKILKYLLPNKGNCGKIFFVRLLVVEKSNLKGRSR